MTSLRDMLIAQFSLPPSELNRIIATAQHRYKVFDIPKRNCNERRTIAQPSVELKIIQRWLVSYLSEHLPIHECATAYRLNRGIKHNASQHMRKRYVLKLDITNFFNSIIESDIQAHLRRHGRQTWSESDISDISRIVSWKPKNAKVGCLCIGAPTSPLISNSIMFFFDRKLHELCANKNIEYTRYADDMTFSTNEPRILAFVEDYTYTLLKKLKYPRLTINSNKTVHTSKGRGIYITGVTLTSDGALSLGRERKRIIRATVHAFISNELTDKKIKKLNGLLAFAYDIEPAFIERLKSKYGDDIVDRIKKAAFSNGESG